MARKNITRHTQLIEQNTCLSRRSLLKFGLAATSGLLVPNAFADVLKQPERTLSLLNLHTGEQVKATYWAEGNYQTSELKLINNVLRDHRTGDVIDMDNNLLELLHLLHQKAGGKQAFNVISGYRSPKTNAMLNKSSSGVAKKSLHMQGKAIDIRLPGHNLADIRKIALQMKVGGVGYYPGSNFLHVDTGRVRQWQG